MKADSLPSEPPEPPKQQTEMTNTVTEAKSTLEESAVEQMRQNDEHMSWKTELWKSLLQNRTEKKRIKRNEESLRDR